LNCHASGADGVQSGTKTRKGEKDRSILVQCGEIRSSLEDRQTASKQLKVRLLTVQRVLQITLGPSVTKIGLLGYIFYSMNGNLNDTVSAGTEFSSDVMIKFERLS
jgi:hypothetical protein